MKKVRSAHGNFYLSASVFSRLLTVFCKSELPIIFKRDLTYPLSPIPLSIATCNGSWRTTNKSKLEKNNLDNTKLPEVIVYMESRKLTVYLVDLIRLVRTETNTPRSFMSSLINWQIACRKKIKTTHSIADTYHCDSINKSEHRLKGTAENFIIKSD